MNTFLFELFKNSVYCSVISIPVIGVSIFLKNYVNARFRYILFLLVFLKLLLPVSFFEYRGFFSAGSNTFGQLEDRLTETVEITPSSLSESLLDSYYVFQRKSRVFCDSVVLSLIYLSGLTIFIVYIVTLNFTSRKKICNKLTPITDRTLLEVFEKLKKKNLVYKDLPLLRSPYVKTPLLFGIFSPCVVIPSDLKLHINTKEFECILQHELVHYKRKDLVLNLIFLLLQGLYWFNPLIHYFFHNMRKESELMCDFTVIRSLSADDQLVYGNTLFKIAQFKKNTPLCLCSVGSAGSLKDRIHQTVSFSHAGKGKCIFGVASILLLIFFTAAFIKLPLNNAPSSVADYKDRVHEIQLIGESTSFQSCFLLYDVSSERYIISNPKLAEKRTSPYSTFKILSALIALKSGTAANDLHKYSWNGKRYEYPQWNRDHTLGSAMRYSVSWYFDRLHADIGYTSIFENLQDFGYGNRSLDSGSPAFWYDGTLLISPFEQLMVLRKLSLDSAYKSEVDLLQQILLTEKNEDYEISGKTGSGHIEGGVYEGWFVGWLKRYNRKFVFVTYINSDEHVSGKTAKTITFDILENKLAQYTQ